MLMRTIKIYFKRAPFYNALIRTYPGIDFVIRRIPPETAFEELESGWRGRTPVRTGGRFMWKWIGPAAAFLIANILAFGGVVVTLKGKVTDASGNPVEHATVMVYHAGVK